jgi:mannose-6-phosphate isomerase-like protein (cupin superfamily)
MDDVKKMTPEEKEAFHQKAEAGIKTFQYRKPEQTKPDGEPMMKQIASLVRNDLVRLNVQVVKEGGENNLHYHTGGDNCWMILRGAARFYGVGDVLIGEFGPHDGILIPGGSRYWFEKIGDEDLEILQISCKENRGGSTARINLDQHKDWMKDGYLQVYDKARE